MRTNFQMEYQNITMIRGDTVAFNVEIKDEDGNAVTVDTADLTCKKKVTETESVFHKSIGYGITQSDGLLSVRIAPEDTREIDAGEYFYGLCVGIDNDIYTLMEGILSIEQNVAP